MSALRLPAATCATNVAARNCTLGAQHQVASCATNVAARNCTLGALHQVARVATEHSRGVVAIFALLTHLVRLLPALRLLHRATLYATRAAAAAALVALCSVALHAVTARAAAAAGRLLAPVAARATAAATSLALLADARFASTPSSPPHSPAHSRSCRRPCYLARCARRAARAVPSPLRVTVGLAANECDASEEEAGQDGKRRKGKTATFKKRGELSHLSWS